MEVGGQGCAVPLALRMTWAIHFLGHRSRKWKGGSDELWKLFSCNSELYDSNSRMVGHYLEHPLPAQDLLGKKCNQMGLAELSPLGCFFLWFLRGGGGDGHLHRCPVFT